MSAESALARLAKHAPDLKLIDHNRSTATFAEAARVIGTRWANVCTLPSEA